MPEKSVTRLVNAPIRKVRMGLGQIRLPWHRRMLQERFDLGPENQIARARQLIVVKGFDSEAITRAEESTAARVPNGKGKHAIESCEACLTPCVVCMQNDFRICFRREHIAKCDEIVSYRLVVVNLAIKDDGQSR